MSNYNANVPFSWELKPGVSKLTYDEGGIGMKHVTLNLPPPPCLSKSARFCVDGSLLPPCQQHQPPPCGSEKKGNSTTTNSSSKKQEDPFVVAYRKCTEYTMNGKLSSEDKDDTSKNRSKKNMFILSCKYSCNVKTSSVFQGRTDRKKKV